MKSLLTLPLAALLFAAPASALSEVQMVNSESTEDTGCTAQVKRGDDGTFGFTITRYLNKPVDESEWNIEGTTQLEIRNRAGVLAKTSVAAKTQKDTVVYWFSLARDCIPFSQFRLSEHAHPKDPTRRGRLGGVIYEFDLPEIAEKTLKAAAPLHP